MGYFLLHKSRACTCCGKVIIGGKLLPGSTKFSTGELFYYDCPRGCKSTLCVYKGKFTMIKPLAVKAAIFSLIVASAFLIIGCGDGAQFQEITEITPQTVFLCQYDEDNTLLRKLEFEVGTEDYWKDHYNFVDCHE